MSDRNLEFSIKLAETEQELSAAQRLRYRVFVEELGATTDPRAAELGLERDQFDPYFDHLILQDNTLPMGDNVVGVYRLMQGEIAQQNLGFYSASEFDLSKIETCGRRSVELGRSCVDARYRGGVAMHLLWNGLADYVLSRKIEVLFGVASFHGTDPKPLAHALSFLHHGYLAPDDLQVTAKGKDAIPMDILPKESVDRKRALGQIPSLIKSYIRLGGTVGKGAFIDHAFNTIDVCLVMDTARMSQKHKAFYEREQAV